MELARIQVDKHQVKEAERPRLKPGQVAIVTGKSAERTPGNAQFSIEIGFVKHYTLDDEESFQNDRVDGVANHGSCIPRGENAGWVGISQPVLSDGQSIEIEVINTKEVLLSIEDCCLGEKLKESTVDSETIKSMGFDLDQENVNNHGKQLSLELTEYLFDFATKDVLKKDTNLSNHRISGGLRGLKMRS